MPSNENSYTLHHLKKKIEYSILNLKSFIGLNIHLTLNVHIMMFKVVNQVKVK